MEINYGGREGRTLDEIKLTRWVGGLLYFAFVNITNNYYSIINRNTRASLIAIYNGSF